MPNRSKSFVICCHAATKNKTFVSDSKNCFSFARLDGSKRKFSIRWKQAQGRGGNSQRSFNSHCVGSKTDRSPFTYHGHAGWGRGKFLTFRSYLGRDGEGKISTLPKEHRPSETRQDRPLARGVPQGPTREPYRAKFRSTFSNEQ